MRAMEQDQGSPVGRAFYAATADEFLRADSAQVLHALNHATGYSIDGEQRFAWETQLPLLRDLISGLGNCSGIAIEFTVPRFGRRIDAVLLVGGTVVVLEFKVGASTFARGDEEQTWDYALDLKNFHEPSHSAPIAPILVATDAPTDLCSNQLSFAPDGVLRPLHANGTNLAAVVRDAVQRNAETSALSWAAWIGGTYRPTPTIIEAARALYSQHSVAELARTDAGVRNLTCTNRAIKQLIDSAQRQRRKLIAFVTGVPGAGKTLVGLEVATKHLRRERRDHGVYLSGNGPLVNVLTEALSRDHIREELQRGVEVRKGVARQKVESFIQNVHHFRDDCIKTAPAAPSEHVTIFDEAQRAWNLAKTADFMKRRKKLPGFAHSEPEFLVSCMDRHEDWAVIVCLVGEGQEINTGEAGIAEWLRAVESKFPQWSAYASSHLRQETATKLALEKLEAAGRISYDQDLHLSVSLRSFRSERLSEFVKCVLDIDAEGAKAAYKSIQRRYPIVLTRNLARAKDWVRAQARGSERYGLIVSSQAQRLKPLAIDVRAERDPVHWFLDGDDDTRSSLYLEDAATEFDIQGLELDWTCIVWDADFRFDSNKWRHLSFSGDRWKNILQDERRQYQKNAYRVLLTRARQGMIVVVPEGSHEDQTRAPELYDGTFQYLRSLGVPVI